MKKFFTTTFACVLGVMIAIVLLSILSVVALTGMVATTETEYVAQPHTILKLDLGTVTERSQEDVMGLLMGNQEKSDGLDNILKAIATAKTSRHIDGIYIDAHGMNMGIATSTAYTVHWSTSKRAANLSTPMPTPTRNGNTC